MSYASTLQELKLNGNFRSVPESDVHGTEVDFSLNDYLGLAARKDLQERFFSDAANRMIGMSASAARLLAAEQTEFHSLESDLSRLYGGKDVLLFNSGYHANTGLLSSLASEKGTLVVADKLVHASMIDGIVLSRAPFKRFVHNDYDRLAHILDMEHGKWERILVAVESVYSMDGDRVNLDALLALKSRYPEVMLYVDEAHAFGVLGDGGLGLACSHRRFPEIDVVVGTFGKACASAGAFAVLNQPLRDYAVNRARSFIFSTALPPMTCAWTRFVIDNLVGMDTEREHLQRLAARLSSGVGLADARYIVPVVIGSAEGAVRASRRLLECGMKVLPIRTPTVPPGTERLRVSLSAAMSMADVDSLLGNLKMLSL